MVLRLDGETRRSREAANALRPTDFARADKLMTRGNVSRVRTLAFTLIEMLVVMAITTILLGLIFGPMVQSFNLTNRARVQVLAQDTARAAMETIQRDISNGVFVFDNTNQPINLWVRKYDGSTDVIQITFGMVDFVPPARVYDQNLDRKSVV